jgi:hypothetical protein
MMATDSFCTHCGAPLGEGRFCTSCGAGRGDAAVLTDDPGSTQEAGITGAAPEVASSGPGPSASTTSRARGDRGGQSSRPSRRSLGASGHAGPEPPPPSSPHAGQPDGRARVPWLAFGLSAGVVLILVVVTAVILLVTAGKPSPRAKDLKTQTGQLTSVLLARRALYVAVQRGSYSTLLPAGWAVVRATLPGLADEVAVRSPLNDGATITVGRIAKPSPTISADAAKVLKGASSAAGFKKQSSTSTKLAGGRAAWVVNFSVAGQAQAAYVIPSCHNRFEVAARATLSQASVIRASLLVLANTIQGSC